EPEEEPEPEPEPEDEPEPEPEPDPEPTPEPDIEQARDVARSSGLLQFRDALADMRESVDTRALETDDISRGQAEAERTERSLITSGPTSDSGGIGNVALPRDAGGVALAGRETTQVESPVGSGPADTAESAQGERDTRERSDEEIRSI